MKQSALNLLGTTFLGIVAATGCASSPSPGTTSGGTGNGGTSGNLTGVTLVPSATGWIDKMDTGNTIGVQGAWYPYGDAYGEAKCIAAGHSMAECSVITMPDPVATGFMNTAGRMCTSGTTGKVLNGTNGMPDYSNMWGAGIGLDLNASGGDNSVKSPWNASTNSIVGISFKIETPPLSNLRVEFPIPATEGGTAGSDYWGATPQYPASPVMEGVNKILWTDVKSPAMTGGIAFDPTQILSLQFHVPSSTAMASPYSFCVSELTFLKM